MISFKSEVELAAKQCMSSSIDKQAKGCSSLRRMLSSDLSHVDEIIESGVISQLIKFLCHNKCQNIANETLLRDALFVLTDIGKKSH